MTTFIITKHSGAVQWVQNKGIEHDCYLEDANRIQELKAGDVVVGTLPIHVVYELNQRDINYLHIALDIPPELDGQILDAAQLEACNPRLESYYLLRNTTL